MRIHRRGPLSRLTTLALVAVMLVGMAVTASAAAYSDTAGHWGEAAIGKWSEYGVLQGDGDGTFAPERLMTVDELSTVLANAFGYTDSYKGELPGYTGTWGEEAVRKAIAAGALTAAEAPAELTRELAAKIMAKALGVSPAGGETKFSDDYAVAPKYKPYVNALGKLGVFNGDTRGRFMPDQGFKRAEVMQVFDNTLGDIIGADKTVELEKGALINKGGVTLSESAIDGDLYIGQGVGDGDVTLDNVTITGRLVVFGGGSGSIHIKGASVVPNVVVSKTFGQPARISVESAEATVGTVTLAAGGKSTVETSEGATIEKIELPSELSVTDEGEVVPVKSAAAAEVKIAAAAETVEIASEGAKVELTAKAQIETLAVESAGAAVSVDSGATVKEATVAASDVSISGAGKVDAVTVTAEAESGVTIKTSGTTVTVDENAGAVTTGGGTTIDPGKTADAKPDTSTGGGGGGGGTGGGVVTPTFTTSLGSNAANVVAITPSNTYKSEITVTDSSETNKYYGQTGNNYEAVRDVGGLPITWNNLQTQVTSLTDTAYPNVIIKVTLQQGTADNAYLLAWDGSNTFETIKTGFFGNKAGIAVSEFDAVSTLTFFATAAGRYAIKLDIVNVANNNAVLATSTVTINVVAATAELSVNSLDELNVALKTGVEKIKIPAGTTIALSSQLEIDAGRTVTVEGTLSGNVKGGGLNSEGPWGRINYEAVGISAAIDGNDTFTFGSDGKTVTWNTGHLYIGKDITMTVPAGVTWTFESSYGAVTVLGELTVNGTLIGTIVGGGEGTELAPWGHITYESVGITAAIDGSDAFTFGVSDGSKTVTWKAGHLHIGADKTMTVPAGVTWTFDTNYNAEVLGTLTVAGTLKGAGSLVIGATGKLNVGTEAKADELFAGFTTPATETTTGAGVKYSASSGSATFTILTGATIIREPGVPNRLNVSLPTGYAFTESPSGNYTLTYTDPGSGK